MPTIRKTASKPTRTRPRTRPRIEDTESNSTVTKPAKHRQAIATDPLVSGALNLQNGEMLIMGQLSELVPVGQYANVTLGPVMLAWKLGGIDMSILADVEWEFGNGEPKLTAEQQAVFERALNGLKATSHLLEIHLSEDRETVERSVRMHNEREASEQSKKRARRG